MNRRSTFSLPRALCTVVMLISWLAISNHCALGSLAKSADIGRVHTHCCGSNAPQKGGKAPDSGTRECCKTLHSLPGSMPAKLAKPAASPLADWLVWVLKEPALAVPPTWNGELLESGPPLGRSFAETVLQRSLLSHAPPRLA